MENKITNTKIEVVLWLIFGTLNLLIYTESFGNHNKYKGIWLLTTVITFCMFIIKGVTLEILRNKNR